MLEKNSWLLPDGIEEVLPEDARHLESLRRNILDMFACWGYELVIPPFIDFLDSLLTGSGHDLALQTFKITDQISGEMLGIRADMTPQVARMDAHNLTHEWPARLCYAGTVLHAHNDALDKSRSPMQIGAELYGHAGKESDLEVIQLMLAMLAITGVNDVHLDLGHVGIFRGLSQQAALNAEQEAALFDVLQRKACPELAELLASFTISPVIKAMFLRLPELNGGLSVIEQARQELQAANDDVKQAITELETLAYSLKTSFPELKIGLDMAELRGYHYHTGVVFAAFIAAVGREIARGGRYDNIGAVFGRARPATGFSADLKLLSNVAKATLRQSQRSIIYAPWLDDIGLANTIKTLRSQGLAVIQALPGQTGSAEQLGCTSILEHSHQGWVIKALN
ncbi:MAG: ATP phosphoribosyltransferase regulatory subunit [Methylococcaceae bacterium]